MRIIFAFACLLVLGTTQAQQSHLSVQAAHTDYMSYSALDNDRNLLITYGNYDDKIVKFWNKETGTLLESIYMPENLTGIALDDASGTLVACSKNNLIVFNTATLSEVKKIPVGLNTNEIVYRKRDGLFYFTTGEFDDIVLNSFNSKTNVIEKVTGEMYPFGQSIDFDISKNEDWGFINSGNKNALYEFATGKYYVMEVMPLLFFENMDGLFVQQLDATHVKAIRYNGTEGRLIWERTLVVEDSDGWKQASRSQVAVSEDESFLWIAPEKSTLIELDANTGTVKGVIYTRNLKRNLIADGNYVYALEVDSDRLFAQGNYHRYKRYDEIPVAQFGYKVFPMNEIGIYKTEEEAIITSLTTNGKLMTLSANKSTTEVAKMKTPFKDEDYIYGQLQTDLDSKTGYFLSNGGSNTVYSFEMGDANSFKKVIDNTYGNYSSVIDVKNKLLVNGAELNFDIISMDSQQTVYTDFKKGVTKSFNDQFNFSENGDYVAISYRDEVVFESEYKDRLGYYNISAKKLLWESTEQYNSIYHINNDTQLIAISAFKKKADIIDVQTGKVVRTFSMGNEQYSSEYKVNPSKTKLLSASFEEGVKIYDIATGKVAVTNPFFKGQYNTVTDFYSDDIYTVVHESVITFFRVNETKELFRIILFKDGEWVAHTPEGLFDGSQNAWDRIVFVKGKSTIPLDQVFDKFYTPRLIYKALFEEGDLSPDVDIDDIKTPPTVTMTYKEGTRNLFVDDDVLSVDTKNANAIIELKGNANGDRISELRLFHNNKLVTNKTRNLTVEDDVVASDTKSYTITLLPGENRFRAIAINSQQTESSPEELLVNYTAPKEEKPQFSGIQTHLIVIGIDAYKNPKYNLNYAVADATSFKDALKTGITPITSNVNVYNITNEEANRTKILETFQTISTKAKPQDVLIFYYAGHGMVTQDQDKQFYLVPHDVTQIYGASEGIKQKGISAEELKKIAATIPAQKQLYILDACQSGGALGTLAVRGAAEEKAIAQLARSTGTHWLTASGSEQYATEFDQLGHGVFTYALLEALSGKADSGDNRVTVNELKAYLESRVPEISKQYKGSPQYPSSFGFGQDFPISVHK